MPERLRISARPDRFGLINYYFKGLYIGNSFVDESGNLIRSIYLNNFIKERDLTHDSKPSSPGDNKGI